MPVATIQGPDGRTFTVEVPDGATEEQILEFVQSQSEPEQAVATSAPIAPAEARAEVGSEDQEFTAAEQEANEILGVDPNIVERGAILPFGLNAQGETEFAVPEIALGVARSFLLPGQALQGTEVTPQDAANLALNVGTPAKVGGTVRRNRRMGNKFATAKQIADAPSAIDLTKASGQKFKAARQAGATLSPDDYVGFLAGAERDLAEAGIDSKLHPKLTAVFNALTKKMGEDLDAQDLHNVRRTIGIATESGERDEARIARILRDNFDDFVENLPGTPEWVAARKQYIQARKAETVENAILKAEGQASGLENGLRVQFRQILNNKREMRNFSKSEKEALEAVVKGDFTSNTLKKVGKLGFGRGPQSNSLMALLGIGAGGVAGGPVGSILAPAAGTVAAKASERRTLKAANTLRALIGGARLEPIVTTAPTIAAPLAASGAATVGRERARDAQATQVE